jgi:clan AA aspartic protease
MKGVVDDFGRALVDLGLRAKPEGRIFPLKAWIDTGLTGELVIPVVQVKSLGLVRSATVKAGLADGSEVLLDTYSCLITWCEKDLEIEVIANNGQFPLLGVGLLCEHRLTIDYPAREVAID